MNFYQKTGYTFKDFGELPLAKTQELLNNLDRKTMIEWLCWADPNGIYRDEDSLAELGCIMSLEEGMALILKQRQKIEDWKIGNADLAVFSIEIEESGKHVAKGQLVAYEQVK